MAMTVYDSREQPMDKYEVVDATGEPIEMCIRCDTDTGLCLCYSRDPAGMVVLCDSSELGTHIEARPAPLTLRPLQCHAEVA